MLNRVATLAAFLVCAASAHAGDYKMTITATDFHPPQIGPLPQEIVTGSVVYSAATEGGAWQAIKAVDFTIAGFTYGLSDVSFANYGGDLAFGGNAWSAAGVTSGTDDFGLYRNQDGSLHFSYAVSSIKSTLWVAYSVTLGVTAVPEPETSAMLLAGLGMVGIGARRRKNLAPSNAASA